METYNKIMKFFWLVLAIVTFIIVTYKCITDDYKTWIFYYVFPAIAFVMYLMKSWMSKRMQKHQQYLKEQENGKA